MTSMPESAPFVVQNSKARLFTQTVLGGLLAVGCAVLLVVAGFSVVFVVGIVVGIGIVVMSVLSLRNSGPLLSADGRGIWLQAFAGPDGVRFLSWESVEAVYVHHMSRQFHLLCVRPRNLEAELHPDPKRRQQMQRSTQLVGAPYSVNLVAAGLSDDRALSALGQLADGRAQVGRR
jgi:hypothetical protein